MNENLKNINGQTSFLSVKERVWDTVGHDIKSFTNSSDAIKNVRLDYEVGKVPVFCNIEESYKKIPDKFSTYRKDTNDIFGVVGGRYTVVQNTQAFTFFDSVVGEGKAVYEKAGMLGKGEKIFVTAKLPDYIRVGKDDLLEKYLILVNTHDGSGSLIAAFTPIRIVCNNALSAAIGKSYNKIHIRHTDNAKEKLLEAHKIMGMANVLSKEMEDVFNIMAKKSIVDKDLRKYIQRVLAPSKEVLSLIEANKELSPQFNSRVNDVLSYASVSDTQNTETTKGTVFGAYNAITGYFQNVHKFKSPDAKVESIILGNASKKSQIAFDLALKMIN